MFCSNNFDSVNETVLDSIGSISLKFDSIYAN